MTTVSALAFITAEGPVGNTTLKFNALNCVRGGKVVANGGAVLVNNVPGIPMICQT